jgi:hypothetical protein
VQHPPPKLGEGEKKNKNEHRRAERWTALTSPSSQVNLNFSHQLQATSNNEYSELKQNSGGAGYF